MKYTKKFNKGGKTPKEIKEEARRNQALEWEAQRVDRTMQADPVREQAVATANIATPRYLNTPTVNIPQLSNRFNAKIKTSNQTFSQAFAAARKAGLKEFTWGKNRYNTNLKGDRSSGAQTQPVQTQVEQPILTPLSEEQLRKNEIIKKYGTEGLERMKNTPYNQEVILTLLADDSTPSSKPNKSGVPQSALQNTTTPPRSSNFMERGLFGWISDNLRRIDQKNKATQIEAKRIWDEKYAKHQQGGQLHLRNGWERFFKIEPPYTPVNSEESITSYMDNPWWGSAEEKRIIRKRTPYADLYSGMIIRNPGTNKADTTFVTPSGKTFKPNDIRSGKAPSGYGYKFFKKPTGYFQQGGVIGSNEEEVVIDFVSRFSQMTGIDPNTDQGQQVLSPVINLFVEGGYIQQYGSMDDNGKDQMVQDIVYQMQEGQNQTVEYAKKGAKLKLLRQYK